MEKIQSKEGFLIAAIAFKTAYNALGNLIPTQYNAYNKQYANNNHTLRGGTQLLEFIH